jgi:hypothetical protein
MRLAVLAILVLAAGACGSSSGSGAIVTTPTAGGSVTTTVTLSGTTRQTSINGCAGDSHDLVMSEGDVSVTLLETTDPAGALAVQICPSPTDNGVCSIKQQRINVGQKLTGVRVGASNQLVKLLPFACVFSNTFDPTPITYKVSVTYQQ